MDNNHPLVKDTMMKRSLRRKQNFFFQFLGLTYFDGADLVILSNTYPPVLFLRRSQSKKGMPKWKKVHKQWAKANGIKAIQNIFQKHSNITCKT